FRKENLPSPDIVIGVYEAPPPVFPFSFKIKQPDPGKIKIKEEYVDLLDGRIVRKRLTNVVFIFGNGENLAVGPCLANLNQIVNFINNRYIEYKLLDGYLLGHAAAAIYDGKGLAIAGFSGRGKSTLLLHLMSNGAKFVTNDRLMFKEVKGKLRMFGVPKWPRINPGTILNNSSLHFLLSESEREKFLKLSSRELWQLEQKYDVFIDEVFGEDKIALKGDMDVLIILNWQPSCEEKTEIKRVDIKNRIDLLQAFIKSPGLFFLPFKDEEIDLSPGCYVNLLSKTLILEITGAVDFSWAVKVCLTFLKEV
ncbi:MAG: HprK-related kinase B, partial [Desulfonauticus sp.]|nr:HprK-related kinase B [Desulfonauticus sp.]